MQSLSILAAVAIGTVIDHSGLPLPLLAAAAGAPMLGVDLLYVAGAAAFGAVVGDVLLYEVGRRVGRETLLAGRLVRLFGSAPQVALAAVGASPRTALILYRYIPAVGKYAPLAAGAVAMSRRTALVACSIGSAVYAAVFALLGWLLQPILVAGLRDSRAAWAAIAIGVSVAFVAWACIKRERPS